MSVVLVLLLTALLAAAAVRMLRGHWMPVTSEHVKFDFRSLTLDGLPMEEIFDPATAVRHPYPLSEPCDMPVFVNVPRFEPEPPLEHHRIAMLASWRISAQFRDRRPNFFSDLS